MRNIGHAFARMGQYAEASSSYDRVLEQTPIRVSILHSRSYHAHSSIGGRGY